MSFEEDLRLGKEVEYEVNSIIQRSHPSARVIDFKKEEYDILIPDRGITVEVKLDRRSKDTGNYFIETSSGGKPSGIKRTTADWWVQVDDTRIVWIRTESLKHLIKDLGLTEYLLNVDDREKKGYLVSVDSLIHSGFAQITERKAWRKKCPF
jgi:hypothetical protein